jgi:retron-type reverse transcriptase
MRAHCYDQAGFRSGYNCDDHLFTITIIAEKCAEFGIPLWVATLDFKKAFDSISHDSIWDAIGVQGVEPIYINALAKLYEDQSAQVFAEELSRNFKIEKGTKQGDLVSPILVNAVRERIMQQPKKEWNAKHYGIQLGHGDGALLNNLRFADDVVLTHTPFRRSSA